MKKQAKRRKSLSLSCEKVRELQTLDADQLANAIGGALVIVNGSCFSKPNTGNA